MATKHVKNTLIIVSDQHSRHMTGCYGNSFIKTPNIDGLAEKGVRFSNAYCNSPVCVPSRASLLTGAYAHVHGYWDNAHAFEGEVPSFGTRMEEASISVTAIGKMHMRSDSPKTGFTDQRLPINLANGTGDIYGSIRNKKITRPQFRKNLDTAGPGETDYIRFDRTVAQQAAEYLRDEVDGQPFLLYVGFVAPHFPLVVPQEYIDMYRIEDVMAFHERMIADCPDHPVLRDYRRYCLHEDVPHGTMDNALRAYYGLCTFLDDQIGVVLSTLEATGLAADTTVIYTSDHGDTMGEHGVFYKSTMYEGSVGVPLILSSPDITEPKVTKTAVSLIDIYPTILDAMSVKPNDYDKNLPGSSLISLAKDDELEDRVVFSEYHGFGIYTGEYMIVKGDYKYVYYVGEDPQLFNLKKDPEELIDLSKSEKYSAILREMEGELRGIVDPEKIHESAKNAQKVLLDSYGGEEAFLKNFKPLLFSPVPKSVQKT